VSLYVQATVRRGGFELAVDVELPMTGVTSLFGRSGCGKTSLLRIIAGLDRVRGAEVRFGEQVWQRGRRFVPLHRRRLGLVFQEHSLLAHLPVRGNLLYGYRRTPGPLRRLHLDEVVGMLGIGELLERRIDQLSGGQRQRVSLGRALLTSPQLLLLDEPLAALDTQTKREIMPFLSRLAREAGVPIILVTHAPEEVERLADRVVFMAGGVITSVDSLQQALARVDSPLFTDDGAACVIEGTLLPAQGDGLTRFGNDAVAFLIQGATPYMGEARRLRVHASDVAIVRGPVGDISVLNRLPVVIERIDPWREGRVLVRGRLDDGQTLVAEITNLQQTQRGLVISLSDILFDVGRSTLRAGAQASITACTWLSRKWPGPEYGDRALLRCFVGRDGREALLDLNDDELIEAVRDEIESVSPLGSDPAAARVVRWPRGMPQYDVGHLDRMDAIDRDLRTVPGVFVAGSAYRGVGIADCIRQANDVAEEVRSYVAESASPSRDPDRRTEQEVSR
jgi:molybdate transport system ATP-binding protein